MNHIDRAPQALKLHGGLQGAWQSKGGEAVDTCSVARQIAAVITDPHSHSVKSHVAEFGNRQSMQLAVLGVLTSPDTLYKKTHRRSFDGRMTSSYSFYNVQLKTMVLLDPSAKDWGTAYRVEPRDAARTFHAAGGNTLRLGAELSVLRQCLPGAYFQNLERLQGAGSETGAFAPAS